MTTKPVEHPVFTQIPDLWHHVVETMDEALFIVDLNRDVLYFNRRAEEITGFSAEEVVGRHCLAAFRCQKCAERCRLFEEEKVQDREAEIVRKDGGRVFVLKNAVALRNPAGEVVGGLETFRDITPLKVQMRQCAEARGRAEERGRTLAVVLGSIREGIVALDEDGKVVSVSRRAREILGLEEEAEAIGLACRDLLGAEICADACPIEGGAARPVRGGAAVARRALTIRGRRVTVDEALSPMVDDEGRRVGHLLILTELADETGEPEAEAFSGLIGRSPAMRAVFDRIRQLSRSEVTVLITGESGTGKELAARALHETSPRARGPFLAVNCAALPEGLLESEIFGHVKGAFTGAVRDRKGRVELAEAGTLFLDEVGELTLPLQTKLLRLVQERTFERVGDERTLRADIRIVAATNRDLEVEVAAGRFRDDLYYRLKVVPIRMPPLRERGHDVALLAARQLDRLGAEAGRAGMKFTRAALEALEAYRWPGNVRELVNVAEYVVALSAGETVDVGDLPAEIGEAAPARGPEGEGDDSDEGQALRRALEQNRWHRIRTAEALSINRVTLYRLMKKHGIDGPRGRRRAPPG
jgi:sigma-54 dependent transcriptional regulator, acetoin dehydrogenase operon transcriptional activator AcoR